jgi:hypothetical protein
MSASAKTIKNTEKPPARPRKTAALPPVRRTIFLPTLLPDPFGEASPELCWEWNQAPARVTLRLTQFGWSASAFVDGSAISHFSADHLQDLRDDVCVSPDLPSGFSDMALPWVLAYEVAGF